MTTRRLLLVGSIAAAMTMAWPVTGKSQHPNATSARGVSTTLTLMAALVLPDLSLRPVPLLCLVLISQADSSYRLTLRSSLDGKATLCFARGKYRISAPNGAQLGGTLFKWD